jgi:hypothetical protein
VKRRTRIIIGVLIFALYITLLIWAFKPLDHITRTQPIAPQDLQLPTPTSLLITPFDTAQDKPITVS